MFLCKIKAISFSLEKKPLPREFKYTVSLDNLFKVIKAKTLNNLSLVMVALGKNLNSDLLLQQFIVVSRIEQLDAEEVMGYEVSANLSSLF